MDQLYYRCPTLNDDVAINIAIDAQSLARLRDTAIGLRCACGQAHELKVAQLFRRVPELPPMPVRDGAISG
jgi:hypothetical protein